MEFVKIVLFSVLAAIVYGEVHDQFTAHLCVEYFSIAHPDIFHTTSPFLLAVGWGFVATWWVGAGLGIPLAAVMRFGSAPHLRLADVRGAIVALFLAAALSAIAAGIAGYSWAANGGPLPDNWAVVIPKERWPAFSADAWAHLASYAVGFVGGLIVIFYAVWRRAKLSGPGFWTVGGAGD